MRDTNLNPSLARSASHHTSHYHCSHLSEGFIADHDQYRFLWTAIRGLIFLNLVYFDIASTFGSTEPSSSTEQKTKTTENYDAESGK